MVYFWGGSKNTSWAKEKTLANVLETYWSELFELIEHLTFWVMSVKRKRSSDVAWLSYDFKIYSHGNASEIVASWRPRRTDFWRIPSRLAGPEAKFVVTNSNLWQHFFEANRDLTWFNISVQGILDRFLGKTQPNRSAKCQISSQRETGSYPYPIFLPPFRCCEVSQSGSS